MGYSAEQIRDLEETINASVCDLVLFATPIQLTRIVSINKPAIRVRYEYEDKGSPALQDVLLNELKGKGLI
jgi:predicted GTPase